MKLSIGLSLLLLAGSHLLEAQGYDYPQTYTGIKADIGTATCPMVTTGLRFYFATDEVPGQNVYKCLSGTWVRELFTFVGASSGAPATCTVGQLYFSTSAAAGTNMFFCTATNTWTQMTGSGSSSPGGTNGQIQFNQSGTLAGFTVSGDGTLNTSTGALTVSKTGGVAFAASATTDTTVATNITSGTLPAARLPAPTVSTLGGVKQNTSVASQWVYLLDGAGTLFSSQPSFSDIASVISPTQLIAAGASTLGAIKRITCSSNGATWGMQDINSSGLPICANFASSAILPGQVGADFTLSLTTTSTSNDTLSVSAGSVAFGNTSVSIGTCTFQITAGSGIGGNAYIYVTDSGQINLVAPNTGSLAFTVGGAGAASCTTSLSASPAYPTTSPTNHPIGTAALHSSSSPQNWTSVSQAPSLNQNFRPIAGTNLTASYALGGVTLDVGPNVWLNGGTNTAASGTYNLQNAAHSSPYVYVSAFGSLPATPTTYDMVLCNGCTVASPPNGVCTSGTPGTNVAIAVYLAFLGSPNWYCTVLK